MSRRDFTRRSWLKRAAAAGGLSMLAGCGSDGGNGGNGGDGEGLDTPEATPPAQTDAQFVTTEFNTIHNNNFNPYDRLYHPNQSPGYLFGEMFYISQNGNGEDVAGSNGTYMPGLVKDWSRDGTTYTFELFDIFTWHNGDPVTAQNVIDRWTLDKLADSRKWTSGAFVDCSAPNKYTVELEVSKGANDLVVQDFVANTLINTHPEVYGQFLPDSKDNRGKTAYQDLKSFERTTKKGDLIGYTVRGAYDPKNPKETVLGWGPWKMKRHGQREMIFEKYEDHPYAQRINFPEVKFEEYTDNQARYQAILSDNFSGCDLVVTQTVWDQLSKSYARHVFKRRLGVGWAFNYKRFPDRRVRQALAYAINKPQVVANSGLAEQLTRPHKYDTGLMDMPDAEETHAEHFGDDFLDKVTRYDQDTEKATQLLNDVGWSRDGGKWYDENDERVSITIRTPPTWTEWVNMAQTAAQHLSDFGIDADFETQELVVYYGQTMIQADYDMAAWWSGGARPFPWFAYNTIFNSLQTVADTHNHPEEYKNVPFPVGDPNGDTKSVNWQQNLNEIAQTRTGTDKHQQLARELGWTYNQMMPVYIMNENNGLAILDRDKWQAPGPDSDPGQVFFPLTYMNNHGQINSLGR